MKATEFLNKLKQISHEELDDVHGIGIALADNFIDFVNSDRFEQLYQKFESLEKDGNSIDIEDTTKKNLVQGHLSGQTVCITGTFDMPRNKIKTELESYGANVVGAVTQKTTILLAGQDAGSKLAKAKKLGIRIVEELSHLQNI